MMAIAISFYFDFIVLTLANFLLFLPLRSDYFYKTNTFWLLIQPHFFINIFCTLSISIISRSYLSLTEIPLNLDINTLAPLPHSCCKDMGYFFSNTLVSIFSFFSFSSSNFQRLCTTFKLIQCFQQAIKHLETETDQVNHIPLPVKIYRGRDPHGIYIYKHRGLKPDLPAC